MDNEIGKDGILDCGDLVRQRPRTPCVVRPQECPDDDKAGRDGQIEEASETDALHRILDTLRRNVALRITLVNTEVLQVDEDGIDERDPKRLCRPIGQCERAKRDLPLGPNPPDGMGNPIRHREDQDSDAENRARDEDNRLDRIRPDDRQYAAQHRIDTRRQTHDEDDHRHRPAEERLEE